VRAHLQRRGASFFPQLRSTIGEARNDDELLDAMWDLVWAGEVTNDTFAALRALSLPRSRSRSKGTPRPGRLMALGPPSAAGRWSLVADLIREERTPTERGHALATALLERHGVVTREAVVSEGIGGGYASVYPVLRAMEESGRARRGYFVAGLGAAQFALPGAVDRLRAVREDEPVVQVLAATDPAQPYGAALAWPRSEGDERLPLQRAGGAYVVLVDGRAVLYLERGGRSLVRLPAAADEALTSRAVAALPRLVALDGPMRELRLERIDRGPVADSPLADALRDAGFRPSYRGYLLRR
jgi:ATP-dependent Lhr-like helicase